MTDPITFTTVRTRRPYYAAPIRRRIIERKLSFEHILSGAAMFDVDQTRGLAA